MPSLAMSIEDNSPLIWYDAEWRAGTAQTDNSIALYSHGNFMVTQATGASASFQFTGTGVKIFGAKRGNHGLYQVTVDNTAFPPYDGFAPDPGLFQQTLFSKTDLPPGKHIINITNLGVKDQYVDVDFITWTTNVDGMGDEVYVQTLHNNDPIFAYLPSDAAWTNPPNGASYASGVGRVTTTNGRGVGLYGFVGPTGSPYTVQLDDGQIQTYNSMKNYVDSNVLLYRADGLSDTQHKLTLTCVTTTPGQTLSFDYANVYSLNPSYPSVGHSSRKMDGMVIAAIVLGAVVFVQLLALIFLGWRHWRKWKGIQGATIAETSTLTPFSTMQSDQPHRPNKTVPVMAMRQPEGGITWQFDGARQARALAASTPEARLPDYEQATGLNVARLADAP